MMLTKVRFRAARTNSFIRSNHSLSKLQSSEVTSLKSPVEADLEAVTPIETTPKVRSFQEISKDIIRRRNQFLELLNTNDLDISPELNKRSVSQADYLGPLSVGDLVVSTKDDIAVVLKVPDYISSFSYQIMDHQGSVTPASPSQIKFRVPKFIFIPSDVVVPIKEVEPDVWTSTTKVRESICPLIKMFERKTQNAFEKVYNVMENKIAEMQDSQVPVNLSVFEIATLAGGGREVLYAVYKVGETKFSGRIIWDGSERFRPTTLTVLPVVVENQQIRAVAALRSMMETGDKKFIKKLETALASNKKGDIKQKLSKDERDIMNLVRRYAIGDLNETDFTSLSLVALFLKKFDKHEDVGRSVAFKLLQSLGLFEEWDNPIRSQSRLLPFEVPPPVVVQSSDGFPDRMESVREDFEIPVYCIDAADAHEIDDGLSVSNTNERIWQVYIHIADPASALTLDDPLMKYAMKQTTTAYYPENVIPMFPPWLSNELGLVSDGSPRRCLTFQIPFDSQTKTFAFDQFKVASKRALKVIQITYDNVDKLIKDKSNPDINALYFVAQAFSEYRFQGGALGFSLNSPFAKLSNHPGPKFSIDISLPKTSASRDLVAELMILANHSTALYQKEKSIPGIYRNQDIQFASDDAYSEFKKLGNNQISKYTGVGKTLSLEDSLVMLKWLTAAALATNPKRHSALGLPAYVQTTSPLRRFQDVLCHWQLESDILNEKSKIIDLPTMEAFAMDMLRNQSVLKRASQRSHLFWTLRKIEQLLIEQKNLVFECIVSSNAFDRTQKGYCYNWGLHVDLVTDRGSEPFKIGDKVNCQCVTIDSTNLSLIVTPIIQ